MVAETQVKRVVGVGLVSLSGLAASAFTFVVFVSAGRTLSAVHFGDFAAIWGVVFGAASVLTAFELEAARRSAENSGHLGNLPLLALGTSALLCAGALVGVSLIARMLSTEVSSAMAVAVAVAFYPLFFATRGRLAGLDRLGQYATLSLLEGLLRPLTLIVVGMSATWHFTVATTSGALAWLPWAPGLARSAAPLPGAGSGSVETWFGTCRKVGVLMSGNLAAALLVTGMPATLTLVLGDADEVGIATAVVLASVSRAPLILLQSIYGLLVPWFVRRGQERPGLWVREHLIPLLIGTCLAIVGGAFALKLAVDLLFGGRYDVGLLVSLVFIVGAMMLGVLQIMTARLVAGDRHRLVQAMWWATAGAAICVLFIGRLFGAPPVWAASFAQGLGAMVGLAIALGSLDRGDH